MGFSGFSAEGLALLTRIGGADRGFFQASKPEYDATIAAPAKDFVTAMTLLLQARVSPLIDGQPKTNGSIAPINNDLRFNPAWGTSWGENGYGTINGYETT